MPVLSEEHRSDHSVPGRWGWFLTSLWRVAFCVLGLCAYPDVLLQVCESEARGCVLMPVGLS